MKDKRILTDFDGVLGNWIESFEVWLKEAYGKELEPEQPGIYKVEHRVSGFTSVEAHELVHEFNRTEYIRNLSPFRDSQKYVQKLYDEGYTFQCITAIEDSPEIYERRWQNLKDLFGPAVDKLTLTGDMPNKIHHLTKYRNTGRFWIEDSVDNAKDGHELGLETILVKHSHTVDFTHDDIHPVDTWEEIYEIIKSQG